MRWMSDSLRDFLHDLDDIYCRDIRSSIGKGAHTGSRPRVRIISGGKCREIPAPSGLPEDWYSEEWLSELKEWERDTLDVQNRFPLEILDEI